MIRGWTRKTTLSALAVLAAVASPATSFASGFLLDRFGSDQGNPVTANPYAVYFNPAAIGGIRGTQLTLDVNLAYHTEDYVRSTAALSTGTGQKAGDPVYRDANTGAAHLSNVAASPFGGVASDFGTGVFSAGFASYIPFGGQEKWDKNSKYQGSTIAPGAVDGPQRWDVISASQISVFNTLALALTIPSTRLSFGVSGSYILNSVSTTRARDFSGEDDIRESNGALLEGRSYLKASGNNFALGGGIYYDAFDDGSLRFGASYMSRPAFGQMRLSGTLQTQFGTLKDQNTYQIDFLQTLPDVMRAGVAWRPQKDLEIRLDGEYVRWSAFTRQCIVIAGKKCNLTPEGAVNTDKSNASDVILAVPRNFQDAGGVRLSLSYWMSKETEIFGGGGLDSSAVPKASESPTFFDSLKVNGTLGVRRTLTKNIIVGVSYNHVYYMPVDTKGAGAGLFQQKIPTRSPSNDGTYDAQLIFVNANVTFLF